MKKVVVTCLAAIVCAIMVIVPNLNDGDFALSQDLKIDKNKWCGNRS
jgi:hypothetical protein